ncbi:hypothetical protein AAFF_G00156140 [Aldrovandia affinis]|uniref:Ig-like domain-containing protein n=1 Tax=Aldrovandia affinis TaxID=143900 RepID=A0AAD7RNZ9_9TELE|nr:hypothetical protein AAFF_G00156140 [Aldrovandia affinis]
MLFSLRIYSFIIGLSAAFEVRAPNRQVVAFYRQTVVLGCSYTPNRDSGLGGLVVTWQRVDDSRVVHSFYYEKDQLDRQSPSYKNRTGLFHSELATGNASLRLVQIQPEDSGHYLCSVSSLQGTDKVDVQLIFAAFYTEPRLTVQVHCSNVSFRYESKGYPEPEVWWIDSEGRNLSHHTEVSSSKEDDGLLFLQTNLELDRSIGANLTFTLKNRLINQVIERPVSFSNAGLGYCTNSPRNRLALLLPPLLLLCFIVALIWNHWKKS